MIEAETGVLQPELQYMNNYQGQASRMKCFADITEDESLFTSESEEEEEQSGSGYYHCDAAQYEFYLHDTTNGLEYEACDIQQAEFEQKQNQCLLPAPIPQMTMSPAQQAAMLAL